VNPTERRNARHYALQAMYQWQLSDTPVNEIESEFLFRQIKKKVDLEYFKELIHAIPSMADELDNHMIPFLSRPIQELDPIELAILRLSIYELSYRSDIPYRVTINEALEMTKKFGSVEGYKFVNGILDKIARKLRPHEVAAGKK